MLAVLADILEQERRKKQPAKARPLPSTIAFVKEDQRLVVHSQDRQNLLQLTQGWEMEETPLPRGGTVHNSKARHYHVVSRGKEGHPGGVDATVGRGL